MKRIFSYVVRNDLKTYIIKEVMVLFLITVTLIAAYSSYQNKRALTQFSHDYVSKYTESLVDTIEAVMHEPSELSDLIAIWLPKIQSVSEIKTEEIVYLRHLLKVFYSLSGFHFGLENGDIMHFHTITEGDYQQTNPKEKLPLNVEYCIVTVQHQDGKAKEIWQYFNKNDKLIFEETIPNSNHDPRLKDWYIAPKASKGMYISPTIKMGSFVRNLIIATSRPFLDAKNNVWGVVAANIDMRHISQFLKENIVSTNTLMFILNDEEQVVASSNLELPMAGMGEEARLLTLKELEDSVYSAAYQNYKTQKREHFELVHNNNTYIANFTRFKESFDDAFGKKWTLVTLVPFNEIFSVFLQSQQDNFGIYIFAFILVLLRIIILSRKLSDPIEELTEEAIKIRQFQFEGEVKTDSKIKEVKALGQTMQALKVSLKSFTKYMPQRLVMRLLEKNQDIQLGGESKKLTIFFSDVAGFTTVSEGMAPQTLMTHISDYFEQLTQIIIQQNGTIDKYIGDAIMAFWGAPDDDPLRSFHACRAALLCQHALKALNANWSRQGKSVLNTRMGIHCGEVVVGNMGSSERMNYTLIGDAVNLSSRLEGTNKFYGTNIIISHAVYEEIKDDFLCRIMDIVAVKGKNQGIKIYELLGQRNAEDYLAPTTEQENFVTAFDKAFEFYLKMNWAKALSGFEKLLGVIPTYDETVKSYIERCQTYIKTPPSDDWDGVYHLTSK